MKYQTIAMQDVKQIKAINNTAHSSTLLVSTSESPEQFDFCVADVAAHELLCYRVKDMPKTAQLPALSFRLTAQAVWCWLAAGRSENQKIISFPLGCPTLAEVLCFEGKSGDKTIIKVVLRTIEYSFYIHDMDADFFYLTADQGKAMQFSEKEEQIIKLLLLSHYPQMRTKVSENLH